MTGGESGDNVWFARQQLFVVVEVNIWMWFYGRALPRKVSVDAAAEMWQRHVQESGCRELKT
jgi:hypothetical protein